MNKEEAKKIFDFQKSQSLDWGLKPKYIFVGYHYFEKSDVLFVEFIQRFSFWNKTKGRYVCQANYSVYEFNDMKYTREKMQDHEDRLLELDKEKKEKELTLFEG